MKTQRTEQEINAHLAFAVRYRDQLNNEIMRLEETLKRMQSEPIKITQHIELEIKPTDEPELMTWYDAMAKFGPDGTDKEWRLPTRPELAVMFSNKDKIPRLQDSFYWSSTEASNNYAWHQRFSDGGQVGNGKNSVYLVRCVRR